MQEGSGSTLFDTLLEGIDGCLAAVAANGTGDKAVAANYAGGKAQ